MVAQDQRASVPENKREAMWIFMTQPWKSYSVCHQTLLDKVVTSPPKFQERGHPPTHMSCWERVKEFDYVLKTTISSVSRYLDNFLITLITHGLFYNIPLLSFMPLEILTWCRTGKYLIFRNEIFSGVAFFAHVTKGQPHLQHDLGFLCPSFLLPPSTLQLAGVSTRGGRSRENQL